MRQVLHVDVAAFEVAVEQVVDPSLKRHPVAVAPLAGVRSLVAAVSHEAYREGVHEGLPLNLARRRCRGLVVLPPNPPLYRRADRALATLCARYSPVVEPARHGRTYLDLTGTERLFGPARDAAVCLQLEIRRELRLEARLGVASNKLVSKVATKVVTPPPGVESVAAGDEGCFLAPLPVRWLPGVGKKVFEELADFNIQRVGELAEVPVEHLTLAFGRVGFLLSQRARGIDPTPVYPPRKKPAIHEEETLASDTNELPLLLDVLYRLIERAGRRLRSMSKVATRLSVLLRHADSREARRSVRLYRETDLDIAIFETARVLLEKLLERRVRIRWLALDLENLADSPSQLELFATEEAPKTRSLLKALDQLRGKYGEGAVMRGGSSGRGV